MIYFQVAHRATLRAAPLIAFHHGLAHVVRNIASVSHERGFKSLPEVVQEDKRRNDEQDHHQANQQGRWRT
jgi:hypothetical protein